MGRGVGVCVCTVLERMELGNKGSFYSGVV